MRSLKTHISLVKRKLGIRLVIDYDPDYRKTIFLAGTGRSGTTWISELINYKNEYRYIFEPFNYEKVPMTKPFGGRKYMRPGDENAELLEIMRVILTGKIHSAWTERFNWRFVANQRLIKAVRANLLLKWLHIHFPGMPIVLIFRHPCAVASSYANHGWRGAVEPLLAQDDLVQDFLYPYKEDIAQAGDRFERAVFIWCIETLVPLRQFSPGEIHIMFYENLIVDPETEIRHLFSFLGKDYDAAIIEKLDRPSLTTRRGSTVTTGNDLINSWRRKVTDSQLCRALEIIKLFGLDQLYSEASMPNVQAALYFLQQ